MFAVHVEVGLKTISGFDRRWSRHEAESRMLIDKFNTVLQEKGLDLCLDCAALQNAKRCFEELVDAHRNTDYLELKVSLHEAGYDLIGQPESIKEIAEFPDSRDVFIGISIPSQTD